MNVLFLMVDELSWWALGHQDPRISTPNIDRLAARSMRFNAAYTPSPICVPTRAAIACGRDVHEIGYWSSAEPYDGRERSWGHAVQGAGIPVTSIGKLHYRDAGDDTGFDQQLVPLHVLNGVGWVQALLRRPVHPDEAPDAMARDIGTGDTDYHGFDRAVTEAACDWLRAPERQKGPWCTFVSWLAPHFPLKAPEDCFALYDATAYESGPEPVPDHPILAALETYFCHDRFFKEKTRGIARAAYFALCSFVDDQVGQVLDTLDATGMGRDTLILFTSDHGEMLGEKGFWAKSTMYDSAARVPLLMAGPGVVPGNWSAPVSLIDIAPTICASMGASVEGFSGVDLRQPQADRAVLSEYHDGGSPVGITMLRWGDWKLVHYAEGHAPQLFNMADDAREDYDLAASRQDILDQGMALLHQKLDPEAVNEAAHDAQTRRIEALGGREAVLKLGQFAYTPVPKPGA